jgi:hypothetical protein
MSVMRGITIRAGDEMAIDKAAHVLEQNLIKGDIILTGPIPLNIKTRFLNIVSIISRKVLRGITHACLYLGDGYVLDIDGKIIRPGYEIEKITLKQLVYNKVNNFGGVNMYIVAHKKYSSHRREKVIKESISGYLRNRHRIKLSYFKSMLTGLRYVFLRRRHYPEDLSYKKDISCAEMIARILKRSGIPIGKRASYTYVPPMFLFSRYFKTKEKIIVR